MAEKTIKVGTEFTEIQIPQGDFTLFLNQNSKYFLVSRNSNGDNAIFSNENLIFSGPATIYVKGDNPESYIILSDFFKTLPISLGGSTPTPGQTYNFNAPLVNNGGNISLALTQSLQITQNRLDLNLTADQNFTSLQQRVAQNTQAIGQTVKLTGDQSIGGNKVFTSKVEIDANNEVLKLKNTSNTSNYIAGYEGGTRIYYIGKDSSSSIDLSIKNEYSVNGWITLKTKSKFDQAYTITDNEQIVHKKYVDDTINTNCVKLTGNQDVAGNKKFIDYVDLDLAPNSTYPFMLRFVGDKWASNQSADLFRFHKYGGVCGYKVHLSGTGFGYAEIWGSTLISNMKDPTEDAHGANKRYVDGKTGDLSQLSTTAKGNLVESINEVSTGISSKAGLSSNNNFTGQNTFPKATAPTQALTSQSLFYPAGTNPQDIPNGMGGFILNNP